MTGQLSLPHRFCNDRDEWSLKHRLCADCLRLRAECRCASFHCCVQADEEYVIPAEILRRDAELRERGKRK